MNVERDNRAGLSGYAGGPAHVLARTWSRFTLVRYVVVSGGAFLVDFLGYLMLCRVLAPPLASAVSQAVTALLLFIMQRWIVFPGSRRRVAASLVLTVGVIGISIALGSLTVYAVRLIGPDWIVFPKLVAIGLVFVWNYLTRKYIVFPSGVPRVTSER